MMYGAFAVDSEKHHVNFELYRAEKRLGFKEKIQLLKVN